MKHANICILKANQKYIQFLYNYVCGLALVFFRYWCKKNNDDFQVSSVSWAVRLLWYYKKLLATALWSCVTSIPVQRWYVLSPSSLSFFLPDLLSYIHRQLGPLMGKSMVNPWFSDRSPVILLEVIRISQAESKGCLSKLQRPLWHKILE